MKECGICDIHIFCILSKSELVLLRKVEQNLHTKVNYCYSGHPWDRHFVSAYNSESPQ